MRTLGMSRVTSRSRSTRSLKENTAFFVAWRPTATTTSSKMRPERSIRSRWPNVTGSKLPA